MHSSLASSTHDVVVAYDYGSGGRRKLMTHLNAHFAQFGWLNWLVLYRMTADRWSVRSLGAIQVARMSYINDFIVTNCWLHSGGLFRLNINVNMNCGLHMGATIERRNGVIRAEERRRGQ